MIESVFHLSDHNTTVKREVLAGLTTFLTMMYILFTNSAILSETGMPWNGVFVATALTAAFSTIFIAIFTNLPFAMAPGMGLNTTFAYTLCMGMGYHWKEALAISFLSGMIHIIAMCTPLRKSFVTAIPEYLRAAMGAGLGMFIAYTGLINSGLLVFSLTADGQMGNGASINTSSAVPGLVRDPTVTLVFFIGLAFMIVLSALEKKTGEKYAALPIGILAATFIGIPLNVTRINGTQYLQASMLEGFSQVFLSFFGSPGLLSIFKDPASVFRSLEMICVLSMTGILNSVGTMIGIGQVHNARLFDADDMKKFAGKSANSKLDKTLIANSIGRLLSSLFGTSPATIYLESVTGITAGGRTGLTGLVVGIMFLLCLPLAGFFYIIPSAAVGPALVLAGVSMLTRMRHIDWRNFEHSFPAFMTILIMSLAYSIFDGIALGIICHVIIQVIMDKKREIHPILFIISILYVLINISEFFY